eukprot:4985577-Amphidinium_carterae.1
MSSPISGHKICDHCMLRIGSSLSRGKSFTTTALAHLAASKESLAKDAQVMRLKARKSMS